MIIAGDAVIDKVRKAAVDAGAMVKIVAPRVGGAKLLSKESAAIEDIPV